MTRAFHEETNPLNARRMTQGHGDRLVVINPPGLPLASEELDRVHELPYTREPHPRYADEGDAIPAGEEFQRPDAYRVGFLLLPDFNAMATAAAIDPLRAANYLSARRLYDWSSLSLDGAPVRTADFIGKKVLLTFERSLDW